MKSELRLPKAFPAALAERAFQVGYMPWPAWTITDGVGAIEAYRSLSLAVIGGNLAVRTATDTQTHYTTDQGDYAYCFDITQDENECWSDFVHRSCEESSRHLSEFKPSYPIIDAEPYTVGFMLIWMAQDSV